MKEKITFDEQIIKELRIIGYGLIFIGFILILLLWN